MKGEYIFTQKPHQKGNQTYNQGTPDFDKGVTECVTIHMPSIVNRKELLRHLHQDGKRTLKETRKWTSNG